MITTHAETLTRALSVCRRAFVQIGVFSLGVNVLVLASPLYMMQIYDRVLATRHLATLIVLTLIVAAALVTLAALDAVRGFIATRLAAWLDHELSSPVLHGAVTDALRAGTPSAQGLRDLASLRGFLAGSTILPLLDAPWTPLFLAIVFLMHPLLGWIATLGAALLLLLAIATELSTRARLTAANAEAIRALNEADSAVRNADVIAAMGLLPALSRRWREKSSGVVWDQIVAADRSTLIGAAAKFVRLALQVAMLAGGAYLVMQAEMTAGAMIAATIIMARAVAPMEQAIATWRGLVAAQGAYRRLKALLERTPAAGPVTTLPRPAGALIVDKISYVPPRTREPVLKGVSFALAPGEALALIGPSAAGKTTLARLLVGSASPSAGAVRLDGAEIAAWDAADRGQHVGYLPQTVELFDGTVRENIARFCEVTDEEVVAAAQLAGAHELILSLPQAYETRIGAGGVPLSGGQRQRIGLARAVFRAPRLIVLDEPNANLDAAGDQALGAALGRLRATGTTLVLVTQRTDILAVMDKILVLRHGVVEAFGPRDAVLAKLRGAQQAPGRGVVRPITPVLGAEGRA